MAFSENDLRNLEKECTNGKVTVGELLELYFGESGNICDYLASDYDCSDSLNYWAEINNVSFEHMLKTIADNLNMPAKFKINSECGPSGWPECSLQLNSKCTIKFDWAFDED